MITTTYLPPLDEDSWRRQQEREQDIQKLRKIFKNVKVHLPGRSSITITPPMLEILDILDEAVKQNTQFIPESQRLQYQDVVVTQLEDAHNGLLTFDRIVSLIMLLLALYSAIIASIPEEKNSEEIELLRTQAALLQEIADSLDNRGCECSCLTDDVDSLAHGAEQGSDLAASPSDNGSSNTLNQDADSQD